jgi:hypothetical protein
MIQFSAETARDTRLGSNTDETAAHQIARKYLSNKGDSGASSGFQAAADGHPAASLDFGLRSARRLPYTLSVQTEVRS